MLARQEYAEKVREMVMKDPAADPETLPKPPVLRPKKRRRVIGRFA